MVSATPTSMNAWLRSEQGHVLDPVVRGAVHAVVESAANTDDPHRQAVQDGTVANELEGPQHRETGDRVDKGNQPAIGQAGGDPNQILLGDADVDEAIRKGGDEGFENLIAEIAGQQHDPRIPTREAQNRVDEGASHSGSPSSLSARRYSASDSGQ